MPATPAGANAGDGTASAPAPTVELATAPDIDLLANRYLWHTYGAGLEIPLGGEGARKYSQEYSSPWGAVVEHDKHAGRVLEARRANLRFPRRGTGSATLSVRVHGVASGQRLSVTVNDRRIRNLSLEPSWQVVDVEVPADAMVDGENELRLEFGKRGSAGGHKAYALVHSIAVAEAAPAADAPWPALTPVAEVDVGGDKRPALTGFRRLAILVEVPPNAWLSLASATRAAAGTVRVGIRTVDGESAVLLSHEQAAGAWTDHRVSLADYAGKLVELELAAGDGVDAAWSKPRIALEVADQRTPPPPYKNVILVVVDALRSDRLSVYGETRVKTPRITAEADARGVVYRFNQAASPSSPPSHGSIQTGMIPRVHGVDGDRSQLNAGTPMISTVLGDAGIATAYWGNNAFGMGRLEKPGRWTEYHQPGREGLGIDCVPLIDGILGFAEAQSKAGKRFFVSSLPYETHVPYRFHAGITDKYFAGPFDPPIGKEVNGAMLGQITGGSLKMDEQRWQQLHALYDGEAEYMDGCFGRLVDGLKERGLADDTAIVLTSDHGEGMYEHGRMGHAFGHFAELGNVPFVVFGTGLADGRVDVDVVTSHIDIAPTIMALMGVPVEPRVQGQSVIPFALRKGPWVPRVMSLEYGRSFALRAQRWKLIVDYSGNESVFDLTTDPTEQTDLAGKSPMAQRYLRDLTGFFLEHRRAWRAHAWGSLNNHTAAFVDYIAGKGKGK